MEGAVGGEKTGRNPPAGSLNRKFEFASKRFRMSHYQPCFEAQCEKRHAIMKRTFRNFQIAPEMPNES